MNLFFIHRLFLVVFQTFSDVESEAPPSAFDGYLDIFANLMLSAGGILAILSASRIFTKAMVSGESIYKGSVNLLLGMVLCLMTGLLVKGIF